MGKKRSASEGFEAFLEELKQRHGAGTPEDIETLEKLAAFGEDLLNAKAADPAHDKRNELIDLELKKQCADLEAKHVLHRRAASKDERFNCVARLLFSIAECVVAVSRELYKHRFDKFEAEMTLVRCGERVLGVAKRYGKSFEEPYKTWLNLCAALALEKAEEELGTEVLRREVQVADREREKETQPEAAGKKVETTEPAGRKVHWLALVSTIATVVGVLFGVLRGCGVL